MSDYQDWKDNQDPNWRPEPQPPQSEDNWLDEVLTKNGITHSFKTTQGRHEWRLWRPHLYEFAQLLFKDSKGAGTK